MKPDFQGWATKNDILCSDGVIIRHGAFEGGAQVPIIWNHNYNSPDNVLGHAMLEQRKEGIWCKGYLNDTDSGYHTKEMLKHGDINAISIGADKIVKQGNNVVKGRIYEISLVMAGANPGAKIQHVLQHGDDSAGDRVIIHTDLLLNQNEEEDMNTETLEHSEKTVGDVLATLTDEQKQAVDFMVQATVENILAGEEDEEMKHNVFDQNNNDTLQQTDIDLVEVLKHAAEIGSSSFQKELKHKLGDPGTYGVKNIEVLFPEATLVDPNGQPVIWKDENTKAHEILSSVRKFPSTRLKQRWADLTEKEARARGYVTGAQKFEQVFEIFSRETSPQTVYKKQRLDRDHIIDITDFSIVAFVKGEMEGQLKEELARAILVGDGREITDPDKIKEDKIRPIISEHDLFTIKKKFTGVENFIEAVINAMVEYRGSGVPTMYVDPFLIGKLKLLKGSDGRYLAGHIPTDTELASLMGVAKIIPTTLMLGKGALIVNLSDYTVGTDRGGQITTFEDFDIDFNQYKYLIETRISGSMMQPFGAIHLAWTDSASPTTTTPGLKNFFNEKKNDLKKASAESGEDDGLGG